MKYRSFISLACLLSAFYLCSCGTIQEPDLRGIENLRISRLGAKESNLTLDLHYFNPNKTRLKLKKAEGDAWMDDNFLGHFIVDTLVFIPANNDFRLPVKLNVDMSHLLKNSLTAFLNKEVLIRIEGNARLGKSFLFINYPIHYEGQQDLGELLKY